MQYNRLGKSGLVVSEICLGTMNFGSSCDEQESFRILDHAYENGIDFFDNAELYPVPPKAEWANRTEEIVGKWMKTKPRHTFYMATKIAGPGHGWFKPPVRNGKTVFDRHSIRTALEGSLKRLQTDYVDLYQTHWPDPIGCYEEIMLAMDELVQEGKIRIFGSSNETEWGVMKAQATAEKLGTRRYETVQNNFSINNRRFEDALGDICRKEDISCLPYSPLGGGVLTGKYNGGALPDGARFSAYMKSGGERQKMMAGRFLNPGTIETTEALIPVAQEAGMSVTVLALTWSKQHDFVPSTITGVNSIEQLDELLLAQDKVLDQDTLDAIDAITNRIKYPMG